MSDGDHPGLGRSKYKTGGNESVGSGNYLTEWAYESKTAASVIEYDSYGNFLVDEQNINRYFNEGYNC